MDVARSRRPKWPPQDEWRAVMTGTGAWVIVNRWGEQPLRDSDPIARLESIHLAAAAPTLRGALEALVTRFERLDPRHRTDAQLVQISWGAISVSRPPLKEVMRLVPIREQSEIDFEAA